MSLESFRHMHWLRLWLATLLLCFTLGTVAHAGHSHAVGSTQDTQAQCDYCHGFGGLMDAPANSADVPLITQHDALSTLARSVFVAAQIVGLPPARAPPAP